MKNSSFNGIKTVTIALLFLIPMVFFSGCSNQTSSSYGERLAMQYFEAPTDMSIAKKGEAKRKAGTDALKKQVQTFYKEKNYRNALEVLEQMAEDDSGFNLSQVYFSMGICHFLLKESEPAVKDFLKVSPQDGIKSKSDWYLALTYLKQGDIAATKELLKEVVRKEVSVKRKKKAEELLEQLEQELIT